MLTLPRAAVLSIAFGFLFTTLPALAASSENILYNFAGNGTDGANPIAGLIFDSAGNLYGTTQQGGANGVGTVFQLVPGKNNNWTENLLHTFSSNEKDGYYPYAGLIFDTLGNLYGTTYAGGADNDGTVYELTSANGKWNEKVLHSFNGSAGSFVAYGVIFDAAGNLYGTTYLGGSHSKGTAFQLTPNNGRWKENVLHNFNDNGRDGTEPYTSLVADAAGNFYGTTYSGGKYNQGTVFQLTLSNGRWKEKVLHSFDSNGVDGAYPEAGLVLDAAGNLYGTTTLGGTGDGTVFQLTLTNGKWKEKILYAFGGKDGFFPNSVLTLDAAGNIYGTTVNGGTYTYGIVFQLVPGEHGKWTENVLHNFNKNGTDGYLPDGGLIFDAAGNLYGTTYSGGTAGDGVVFEITP